MKIAIVTCYDQNDYIRARTLRTAFQSVKGVDVTIIRNEHTGLLRYLEVPLKILQARLGLRPDAYVITFRGYEMLLYMALTLVRKPIIFDELINMTESFTEHHKIPPTGWRHRLFRRGYGWLAGYARIILADTDAHAVYSAELNRLPLGRYRSLVVGADETVFKPVAEPPKPSTPFTVFYYGSMLPLHGLSYVLNAARILKDNPNIVFRCIGGKDKAAAACAQAAADGAHVSHEAWLAFEELPAAIYSAGLTMGGPFGDTLQSQFVITTKTYQCLALGAPVLIGANKVNDMFQDKINSLVVPPADAQAIANAIVWAAGHHAEMRAIGKNGRHLYRTKLSQAVANQQITTLVADMQA